MSPSPPARPCVRACGSARRAARRESDCRLCLHRPVRFAAMTATYTFQPFRGALHQIESGKSVLRQERVDRARAAAEKYFGWLSRHLQLVTSTLNPQPSTLNPKPRSISDVSRVTCTWYRCLYVSKGSFPCVCGHGRGATVSCHRKRSGFSGAFYSVN